VLGGGVLVGLIVGGSVNAFSDDLPLYEDRLGEMMAQTTHWLIEIGIPVDGEKLKEIIDPGQAMQMAGSILASFGNMMTNTFLILLTVIFILAEEASFKEKLIRARRGDKGAAASLDVFRRAVNSYMGLKTLVSLMTGVVIYIWLIIVGVDYAILWSLLAFLLNFVPTVGSILAAIPAVLLALIQLGPFAALWTLGGFLTVNILVGNVIEPRLMGRGLNLSSLVVFLSLVFWGWILGPVGMLLSIPLTIMVKIALEGSSQTRWIGQMLGATGEGAVEELSKIAVLDDVSSIKNNEIASEP
jgi:AI-2 transport protein TqsA